MQENETRNYIQHAFELKEQKCYKQAIEMLYKVLEDENDNCEILFQIGELYYLLNNLQRAIQYFEKVIAINSNHSDSLAMLKKIYIKTNMFDEAQRYAKIIFDNNPTSHNLAELISLSGKNGDYTLIDKYQNSHLANSEVLFSISKVYYEKGEIQKSKEILEQINDSDDAKILLGRIYFDESNFEKSKEIFSKLPANYENPEVLNYRGLFYIEDLNFLEAIKSFSKAYSLDKQNACYAYNLGNAYFYNGWIKEATKTYLEAICLAPEALDYRYSLAYLYYETQAFDKAQKELDYILEKAPTHYQAVVLNALLKFKNKDFLGAQNDLENILKTKEDEFAQISLVKVYNELQMFDKAANILTPLMQKYPKKSNLQCELAQTLICQKKNQEALNILEKVIADNENYIPAYGLAAQAAFAEGNLEKTKYFAQRSISLDMNYAQGYYYLALVRKTEKDYDEAIECMKRAITYDLNNAEFYSEMSEIYKIKNEIKAALEYANEASELDNSTKYKIRYSELASINRKNK